MYYTVYYGSVSVNRSLHSETTFFFQIKYQSMAPYDLNSSYFCMMSYWANILPEFHFKKSFF